VHAIKTDPAAGRAERTAMLPTFEGIDRWVPLPICELLVRHAGIVRVERNRGVARPGRVATITATDATSEGTDTFSESPSQDPHSMRYQSNGTWPFTVTRDASSRFPRCDVRCKRPGAVNGTAAAATQVPRAEQIWRRGRTSHVSTSATSLTRALQLC
jgi:hypothetical protein